MKKIRPKLKIYYENKSRRELLQRTRRNKSKAKKKNNNTAKEYYKDKKLVKEDPIYTYLLKQEFVKKYKNKQKRKRSEDLKLGVIEIPEVFSLLDNTDESLLTLKKIMYLGQKSKLDGIHVEQSKTKSMSLCASTILTVLILTIIRKYEIKKKNNAISGHLNREEYPEVYEMVTASGLKKVFNNELKKKDYDKFDDIITLDLITTEGNKLITNKEFHSDSSNVAKSVITYFSKCLETQAYTLNLAGKNFFRRVVGEMIDNCNIHSNLPDSWFCIGYAKYEGAHTTCKLVIFNFGDTIYEGLANKSIIEETPQKLKEMSLKIAKNEYSEENIFTYLAMQDGVSRFYKPEEDENNPLIGPDRGTGTIKLLKEFDKIGKTSSGKSPRMVIISGKTKLVFDSSYLVSEKVIYGEKRDVIFFNKNNNIFESPDRNNLVRLNEYFPGVIISMEFYLEENFLDKLDKKELHKKNE